MPNTRDLVFDRLEVDHLVRGATRVAWHVFYQFLDPGPWTFTLQAGETGVAEADDWVDVGLPVTDAFYAIDDTRRDYGTVRTVHYRVQLVTGLGTYYSKAAAAFGLLGRHDWNLAREIVRKEQLRNTLATVPGWLLKRRRHGTPPAGNDNPETMLTDPLTGDIISRTGPAAESTFGTEFIGGYYAPAPFSVDVMNLGDFDAVDPAGTGNVNPEATQASGRVLLIPYLSYRDVFVAAKSDLRYELGRVKTTAHMRGVPLLGEVEIKRLPYADVIYKVPVPGS